MALTKKSINRLKSYGYLAIFACAIIVTIVMAVILIKNINHNIELNNIKEQLIQERDAYLNGSSEEDCYTVYVKDDYTLDDGELFVFKK